MFRRYYTKFKLLNWNKKSWEYILSKDGLLNGATKLRDILFQERRNSGRRALTKSRLEEILSENDYQGFIKEDMNDLLAYLDTLR